MTSAPLNVGLVFGGASGEHAVSIRSANTVLAGLDGLAVAIATLQYKSWIKRN